MCITITKKESVNNHILTRPTRYSEWYHSVIVSHTIAKPCAKWDTWKRKHSEGYRHTKYLGHEITHRFVNKNETKMLSIHVKSEIKPFILGFQFWHWVIGWELDHFAIWVIGDAEPTTQSLLTHCVTFVGHTQCNKVTPNAADNFHSNALHNDSRLVHKSFCNAVFLLLNVDIASLQRQI